MVEEALDESSDSDEDEMDTSITKPGTQACAESQLNYVVVLLVLVITCIGMKIKI